MVSVPSTRSIQPQIRSVEVAHRQAKLVTFVAQPTAEKSAEQSAPEQLAADQAGVPLSWQQIAQRLAYEAHFCDQWNQTWASLPFDFEWKPVPIHPYTASTHPFFAIVFPAQFRPADPTDFERYLNALESQEQTASFANFSGDAELLVPAKTGNYGHIAAFCRTAPTTAFRALWQQVGRRCLAAIESDRAVWCNTHGHGVPWLHIRFDSRLKYAAFPPRGNITANSQAIWYQQIYGQVVTQDS